MRLQGKKALILVANEFEDIEVFYPLLRLSEEGAWITLGVLEMGWHPRPVVPGKPLTGRLGSVIPPMVMKEGVRFDIRPIAAVSVADYDAVIIPGGFAPDYLRRDPATVDLVREFNSAGKPVAAICHGPWLLVSAGVLGGRKATCFFSIKDDVTNAGAEYVDQAVVVDGNVITSRTPDDLPQFCGAIMEAMRGE
ncbi:MAG: type 1 glutamine amidotransferase [Firmicutes bacterium]|jgi:protease I|nr:type 1 glutamine amidotransferase [Bacillota bacterium]